MRVQVVSLVVVVVATIAFVACSGGEPTTSGPASAATAPNQVTSPPVTSSDSTAPTPDQGALQQRAPARRSAFVPLENPVFIEASEATYLNDDELVLGLEWAGEARAYPVQMMFYHHIVNDEVSSSPVLITY